MTLEDLKDRLNNTAAEALQWLMPAGYVSHNTFYCGDVFGTPASKGKPGSFTFHLQKLIGKDFASGDRGYFGVYDIFVAHAKGNQTDAIRLSREFLKLPPTDRPQINHHHERGARDRKKNNLIDVVQVYKTCPGGPPEIPKRHRSSVTNVWPWQRADGCLVGYSYRLEFVSEGKRKKILLPLTWCQLFHKETQRTFDGWHNAGLPAPQPLMAIDEVLLAAESVLIVEGEKTGTAARALSKLTDHPLSRFQAVTTWHGGVNRLEKVDWRPLHGKRVVYWPDADQCSLKSRVRAGFRAGEQLPLIFKKQGITVGQYRLVEPGLELPDGWDLADPLPDGLGHAWLLDKLDTAEVYVSP
ncbi:hypothetical protein [Thalassospira sp. MCCC 1A01428]|uniref:hypothetical protein n=1 Tax=Thalassospira sp. MCCC 1A01428 TaxID=1470575 RepID=UPI000A1E9115|nr:hypothetical protein [Thalassospira sp. MCCC 1A01428]OSQ38659.1 hypothetical protein THS27_21910 [Thalassospira sp. MCCC 1A01428]|tara:strand:+ start:3172 stop:4236 length:1065 start_codon:yes stop_codon:yes gene_type:complete